MRKGEKILVPIDFSEGSASALGRGLALARETGAELIALHVIEPGRLREYFSSYLESREASPLTRTNDPIISMDVLLRDKTQRSGKFHREHNSRHPWSENYQTGDPRQSGQGNRRNHSGGKHRSGCS